MLAARLDIEPVIARLSRCSQQELDRSLRVDIFHPSLKLSRNSKIFVWRCLQIAPNKRLTSLEAERHEWLCAPEKHLNFFKQLDRKVLRGWEASKALTPMPLQLPSVLLSSLIKTENHEGTLKDCISLCRNYPLLEMELARYGESGRHCTLTKVP